MKTSSMAAGSSAAKPREAAPQAVLDAGAETGTADHHPERHREPRENNELDLLAGLLRAPGALASVRELLGESDATFVNRDHGRAWCAAQEVLDAGGTLDAAALVNAGVDPVTVREIVARAALFKGDGIARAAVRRARAVVEASTGAEAADAPTELPPPPLDALPRDLDAFIEATAAARCVDPAMPFTFVMGVAAAAIGRAAEIELRDGWREIAPLWLGHVAGPGKQKSPLLKAMAAPLFAHDDDLDAAHAVALAEWENRVEIAALAKQPAPERPRRAQAVVSDVTIEALADVLQASGRVAGVHDELGALFDSMGSYKKAGGHDRQSWLSLHAGARITVNRKGKDPLIVPAPRLGIIGATTPATAARVLSVMAGDGLADRFLLTSSRPVPNKFQTPAVPAHLRDRYAASIAALCALPTGTARVVMLSPEAAAAFGTFYESLDADAVPPHFGGVIGKLPGHVARIALTLTLWADPAALAVSGEVMAAAIRVGEWLAEHTAALRGAQALTGKAAALVAWLQRRGGRAFLRDLVRANVAGITSTEKAEAICAELVASRRAVVSTFETLAGHEKREVILVGGEA